MNSSPIPRRSLQLSASGSRIPSTVLLLVGDAMRDYHGHFEVHLTIDSPTTSTTSLFLQWCEQHQLKCVAILLARGTHPHQPMATWRRSRQSLLGVLQEAKALAGRAEEAGFRVNRLKIEADPHNADLPQTDADCQDHAESNYFEHHVKLRRAIDQPTATLLEVCHRFGAHLSRNAFRQVSEFEERFVTMRGYAVGWSTSEEQLAQLLGELRGISEEIIEHESEYCVYDSNLELDAGWLGER